MKKVEEKNLFQNVRTGKESLFSREHFLMSELCQGFLYDDCPVKKRVEEDKFEGCADWMMEHWEEGLELLGWKKMEEDEEMSEQEKVEQKKTEQKEVKQEESDWGEVKQGNSEHDYFLMRHLGVGYRERFQVEGTDGVYHVGVAGRLFRVYDEEGSRKREIVDGQVLYTLLEHPERVKKGLTAKHREYLEAVLKVFPEVRWVKRDGGWLLFGKEGVVLLTRVGEDWEELKDGEERDVRELLGE